MSQEHPDFRSMSLLELLKWFEEAEGSIPAELFLAIEESYPFEAIFERLNAVEDDLAELDLKLQRLVDALSKNVTIEVSLREWMKQ